MNAIKHERFTHDTGYEGTKYFCFLKDLFGLPIIFRETVNVEGVMGWPEMV